MAEHEWMRRETRNRLESYIRLNEKPEHDWFGCYPAKAAVDASKAQLKSMNKNGAYLSRLRLQYTKRDIR
jgi:hypothetical protein